MMISPKGEYIEGIPCILILSLIPLRLLSSSFLGLPYRILDIIHRKELLRGLWVSSIDTTKEPMGNNPRT